MTTPTATTTTAATRASASARSSDAPSLTFAAIARSLIAGGVAGGVSRTAVAPLERLKILQQVSSSSAYNGVYSGLSHMWKTEGVKGLFKGNGANCVRIVPNSAVKFFCYEHMAHGLLDLRRTFDKDAEMDVLTRLGGGAGAGIVAMSATYPLDMIRGRLTVQKSAADAAKSGGANYRGIYHAFTVIAQKEGFGAFYKGWTPSVIGVIPYVGLNFAIYETLKDQTVKMQGLRSASDLSVFAGLVCGGVAGAVGQTVAYPFDVCRRRLQVSGWVQAGVQAGGPVYTGMFDCFRRTVAEEGVSALFHGLSANYIKIMPSIAIAFVVYDQLKIILKPEIKISAG